MKFSTKNYSYYEWKRLLRDIDNLFTPKLSERTDIIKYAEKLTKFSSVLELSNDKNIVGILVYYNNNISNNFAFITLFLVWPMYISKKYGREMMKEFLSQMKTKGVCAIRLEVNINNIRAIKFYEKFEFEIEESFGESIHLKLIL